MLPLLPHMELSISSLTLPILLLLLVVFVLRTLVSSLASAYRISARDLSGWPTASSPLLDYDGIFGSRDTHSGGPHWQEALRVVRYKASTEEGGAVECLFCLGEVEEGTEVREIDCGHVFHRGCLDRWLEQCCQTCPICRRSLLWY